MSTRYAYVWRREWRGTLKGLTKDEKIVLLALRTGPLSTSLPGLVEADGAMLTSLTELSIAEVEAALSGLVAKRKIAVDPAHCMVRIFGMPDPEEPPAPVRSWKTLQGWWTCWREHPESPLKYDHIPDLRAVCDLDTPGKEGQPSMADTWARTFGSVTPGPSDTPPIPPRNGVHTPSDTPIHTPSDSPFDASVQRTAYSGQRTAEEEELRTSAAGAAPSAPSGASLLKVQNAAPAAKTRKSREGIISAKKKTTTKSGTKVPFTWEQALDALRAGGGVVVDPVDHQLAGAVMHVFAGIEGITLADLTRASVYLAKGGDGYGNEGTYGNGWRQQHVKLADLRKSGALAGWIGAARVNLRPVDDPEAVSPLVNLATGPGALERRIDALVASGPPVPECRRPMPGIARSLDDPEAEAARLEEETKKDAKRYARRIEPDIRHGQAPILRRTEAARPTPPLYEPPPPPADMPDTEEERVKAREAAQRAAMEPIQKRATNGPPLRPVMVLPVPVDGEQ